MRYLIYFFGILMAAIFFIQTRSALERRAALIDVNKSILTEVTSLNKSLAWLNGFQARKPQTLLSSYETLLNNVRLVATANQVGVLIKSKDVTQDKDIKLSAKESPYSGISQIDLEITVSDLTDSNKLAAIFDAFTVLENSTPIIIKGFFQEKDYLIFSISILGV